MLDNEKNTDVSFKSLSCCGVGIESRYGKCHEYKSMCLLVSLFSAIDVLYIKTIACDTKATAVYTIDVIDRCSNKMCLKIGRDADEILFDIDGGHNGIYITRENKAILECDPNWKIES